MKPQLGVLLCLWPVMAAAQTFFAFSIDQDRLGGAPDFSFLNQPLTAGDRLTVCGEHFCRAGDGKRVRLFGVNLAFGGNFPAEADAPRIAKRLRRLGVNLVRLHHMDSAPDSRPSDARSLLTTGPYPTLNPVAVQRLRVFLDALKVEGIYADLNLHVGYRFRPEVDGVPPISHFPSQSKPLNIFYPRMIELQREYARKTIEVLKLRDNPVLALVEINNESSLAVAWQDGKLAPCLEGDYKKALEEQWNAYLRLRYGAAIGAVPIPSDESPDPKRLDDYLLFLVDRDRAFLKTMAETVREAVGRRVPIGGTQLRYGGLMNLDSHQDLDFQDNHGYVDHYQFPQHDWDSKNWRIKNLSTTGNGLTAYIDIAVLREAGEPYTVSEYNQGWPNTQAAEIDPVLAALAAFQDWDSIMHFAYTHGADWDTAVPTSFNLNADMSKLVLLGQAAWMYRAGIRTGVSPIDVPVSQELRLRAMREKQNWNPLRALCPATGLDPANVFLHPFRLVKDGSGPIPEAARKHPAAPYRSDTGELSYDPGARTFLIDAPQAAGVFGYIGTRATRTGPLEVQLVASDRGFTTVLLTSLDGQTLRKSHRLLLGTPGTTAHSQPGSNPPRPQKLVNYPGTTDWWTLEPETGSTKPSGDFAEGIGPVWMERVESFVELSSPAKSLRVFPLGGDGAKLAAIPASDIRNTETGFHIHLQAAGQALSPWYELDLEY